MNFKTLKTVFLFLFLNQSLCFAQRMNDRFKVYVCPETLYQGCKYQINWTDSGEEKYHEAVKFKNFTFVDPGGNEFKKVCLSLKFGKTQLTDWLKINPNRSCHNNMTKIYFLDYGFFLGDFEVYHADGSFKEQLRLVKETSLILSQNRKVFKSTIKDVGIIRSLGDEKKVEEVKTIWGR